ncbi:MAG TPA: alpha/beta fold hydrolase [Thermoanaerobaculia bacterium]|nr:alpha/beta fold hydrolase [Thermoanaerobaculia bacterium]
MQRVSPIERFAMRHVIVSLIAAAAAVAVLADDPSSPVQVPPGRLRFEPVKLVPRDGSSAVIAEFGHLTVLENRSRPYGAVIELAFVRFKAKSSHPGTPVIWLAGGPGGSGTQDAEGAILPLFQTIAEFSDVIALDQRGMGLSAPRLECPGRFDLPLDRPMERNFVLAAFREKAGGCRELWQARGVDLASYNTAESARDIEDLRRALGVPRVSLLAGSYGSHLALAAIRLFESSIERAVLFGVQGPDHMERLPGDFQEVLVRIDDMVKRTPLLAERMPTFLGAVQIVMSKLEREPIRVESVDPGTGERRTVTLGKFDLQCFTRNMLSSREQISRLPGLFLAMLRGDFQALAAISIAGRKSAAPPAVDFTMRCASGSSSARRARIAAQAQTALLGDGADFPIPAVCDAWGVPDLGEDFRAPISSSVPVLFVSGTLDAHTPTSNAREVLAGFSNGRLLVVDGGAHCLLGFSLPKGRKITAKFLRGDSVSTARLSSPAFEFFVPELSREGTVAAEFGRSLRAPLGYIPFPH